jgi:hypothetical protein
MSDTYQIDNTPRKGMRHQLAFPKVAATLDAMEPEEHFLLPLEDLNGRKPEAVRNTIRAMAHRAGYTVATRIEREEGIHVWRTK